MLNLQWVFWRRRKCSYLPWMFLHLAPMAGKCRNVSAWLLQQRLSEVAEHGALPGAQGWWLTHSSSPPPPVTLLLKIE